MKKPLEIQWNCEKPIKKKRKKKDGFDTKKRPNENSIKEYLEESLEENKRKEKKEV